MTDNEDIPEVLPELEFEELGLPLKITALNPGHLTAVYDIDGSYYEKFHVEQYLRNLRTSVLSEVLVEILKLDVYESEGMGLLNVDDVIKQINDMEQ